MVNLIEVLSNFSTHHSWEDTPTTARKILKLSLLDWCACGIAGTNEPVSKKVRALVELEAGAPQSTVYGQTTRFPARAAALANGATSHALDYDDTHFLHIGHPSVAIFPAALAMAEYKQISGSEFLEASLVGYEASCRLGNWLGRAHYEVGFHQTATAGAFGATLASCRVLELNSKQTQHALGIAATRASGLKSQFGTMGKPFNAGIAASNGVEAAQLAALDFISNPLAVLQFGDTHSSGLGSVTATINGLGTTFVSEDVQFKFHACCHGLHASLEALRILQNDEALDVANIKSIRIETHPRWLDVCNQIEPVTGLQAKFSYKQVIAMALLDMNTGALNNYSETICQRPEIIKFRQKIEVHGNSALSDAQAHIEIDVRNQKFVQDFNLVQPIPVSEKEERVLQKVKSLIGQNNANRLWDIIQDLENEPDIQRLSACLTN